MISQGDALTADKVKDDNVFFTSYKGKYILMDNLDEKYSLSVKSKEEVFNTQYVYVTVVTRGTLHMRISGVDVDVKENDYIVVTPCMKVEVFDSRCRFLCFLTQSHIVNDIYERIGASNQAGIRCFCFHHYTLPKSHVDMIISEYNRMKYEHARENYKRKEVCIRALLTAYECHMFERLGDYTEHNHYENTRQREFFQRFLDFLSLYCKKERSVQFYADRLKITPKYLSNLTNMYTGFSASIVIDQYVAYSIKRMLYSNEHNIKKVSDMYHFPSQSFFGRYFKRIVGVSPNAYIKEHNKKATIEE